MKRTIIILASIITILLIYFIWASSGKELIAHDIETGELQFNEFGDTLISGNFVAIQPYMLPVDYQTENSFFNKLDFYFNEAKQKNWLSEKTIVVLPEYLGTWLAVAEEKQSVYQSKTIQNGLTTIVSSNIFSFANAFLHVKAKDKVKDAAFRMNADKMAEIYSSTFTRLAKKYQVYVVGGSIILPKPTVENNKINIDNGNLYNVSFLFLPNGNIDEKVVVKAYPTADELNYISAGKLADIPIFETPAGKLGIAICADSWFPDIYEHFEKKAANLITIPSFLIPDDIMEKPWNGYTGSSFPDDVVLSDVKNITEKQAWEKYALLGRYKNHGFRAGINVFMRGKLWDLGSDGCTFSFLEDSSFVSNRDNVSLITCLWF
jgi:predicted amidohydrolase